MRLFTASLLVGLLSCPASAADSSRMLSEGPPLAHSSGASQKGAVAASAAREITRLVRSTAPEPRKSQPTQPPVKGKGWIARHPKLFGALVGFGAGCIGAASQVGGSEDTFFNTLDEFACPVVGGIGAAAGALIGSLLK